MQLGGQESVWHPGGWDGGTSQSFSLSVCLPHKDTAPRTGTTRVVSYSLQISKCQLSIGIQQALSKCL